MALAGICKPRIQPWRTLGRALQKPASCLGQYVLIYICYYSLHRLQAYKHIFTSPSSVEKEVKATRSGNARIHGMTRVTPASLAYVATLVCMPSISYPSSLNIQLASLFIVIVFSVLQVWYLHGLGTILWECLGFLEWSRWEGGGCWFAELVELVSRFPLIPQAALHAKADVLIL